MMYKKYAEGDHIVVDGEGYNTPILIKIIKVFEYNRKVDIDSIFHSVGDKIIDIYEILIDHSNYSQTWEVNVNNPYEYCKHFKIKNDKQFKLLFNK